MLRVSAVVIIALIASCRTPSPLPSRDSGSGVEDWYFVLELAPDPPLRLNGHLHRTEEADSDVVFGDLDGDGTPDVTSERVTDPEKVVARNGNPGDLQLRIEHAGNSWTLEFAAGMSCGFNEDMTLLLVSWAAERDGVRTRFEGHEFIAYPTQERAAAEPTRLGPPFRGSIGCRVWGSGNLIDADLSDCMGASLEEITDGETEREAAVHLPDLLGTKALGTGAFG